MSNRNNRSMPDHILKKLILFYAFNLELQQKKASNNYVNCYLINSKWLDIYKDYYNYESFANCIMQCNNFNLKSYDEFANNIQNITTMIHQNCCLITKGKIFPNELIENISFIPIIKKIAVENCDDIDYYEDFYLVNDNVYYLILNDIKNTPNYNTASKQKLSNFFFGQKYTFFINGNDFEVGKIGNKGIFSAYYHIKMINNKNIN